MSRGVAPGLDWGAEGIVCIRSGGRTAAAAHRARSRHRSPRARRAAARRPSSTPSTSSNPTPVTWAGRRRRDGARPALAAAGGDRALAPAGRRRCSSTCTAGPTDQSTVDWKPRVALLRLAGVGRARARTTGARPGTAARTAQALDQRLGRARRRRHRRRDPRRRSRDGWCDAHARRGRWAAAPAGFTALLVAAHTPTRRARGGEPLRRHRPVRPGGDDAPVRVALPRPAGRHAARSTPTATASARPSRTRARHHGAACSCSRVPTTRSCRRRRRSCWSNRCAPPAATVEHHVYDGEGHGFSLESTVVDSFERIDAFLERWVVQR